MAGERFKIWGPPGTGKTTKLISIVNEEMDDGIRPEEIIYTSFTRAACNEAVRRALDATEGNYKKTDFLFFKTEHAICFKLLGLKKDYIFTDKRLQEFGDMYPIYKFTNHGSNFEERNYEMMLQSLGDYYEFFISWMDNNMLPFPVAIREFMKNQKDLPTDFSASGARTYMERRDRFKQENCLWDFTDMINTVTTRRLFPDFKVLICDEAQDMSPVLYRLVEMWSEQALRTYLAGDKFQAIFQFAGASPQLFDAFAGDLEILPHSYRLTPQVKDFAGKILGVVNEKLPEFTVDETKVGHVTAGQIQTIDWLNLGSTFVLARTRRQLRDIADRLKFMGIPFAQERLGASPLESSRAEAFRTLIKLNSREKITAEDLRSLAKHTRVPWLVHGAKTKIKDLVDMEYTFNQVQHFFSQDFVDKVKTDDYDDILCQDVEEGDKSYLTRVFKKCGVNAFLKKPDITLTTIHGSKGRQRETVVISPELGKRAFDGFLQNKQSEVFVAYVAATRSMKRIIMLPRESPESFPYPRPEGKGHAE